MPQQGQPSASLVRIGSDMIHSYRDREFCFRNEEITANFSASPPPEEKERREGGRGKKERKRKGGHDMHLCLFQVQLQSLATCHRVCDNVSVLLPPS